MNRLEYNIYRRWKLPADENGLDAGYLVEYIDGGASNHSDHEGYISWSPKQVFDNAYKLTTGLTFGMAIEALKLGLLVGRKDWNQPGLCVMKQIPAEIGLEVIPHIQSVQATLKAKLIKEQNTIKYRNQMILVQPNGLADSWVASSSDIFAEDWYILK